MVKKVFFPKFTKRSAFWDGSFDAALEFEFLVESYISHVKLERPKCVKTTVSQGILFDHLINIWEFNPCPVSGACNLYLLVDFKFQSRLYKHAPESP
ncbi:hypothetical protein Ahy_A02g008893 [Arachis hypogaea]|uniref:Uncharacterized protein n=1 Tax=Arachis hypogaea TaxID=3818 RepID=A0A445EFS1_ARAHY|nr:hypothetical protein Ahy_A02g008893 [Arachis hypogaea]